MVTRMTTRLAGSRSARDLLYQPGEPDAGAFDDSLPGQIRRFWLATRPPLLTGAVMPVLVGTAWGAAQTGSMNLTSAVLAVLCLVLGQAAGNLINDIHDDLSGNDAANTDFIYPFTGGSRFIQNGVMDRRTMLIYALVLLGLAVFTGLILLVRHGWGVAGFGALLLGLLALYHLPPVQLGYRGVGEGIVALAFGIIPLGMASWLQGGSASGLTLLVALPVALWAVNLLVISEIPDRDADARSGKNTFVVLFGVEHARILHKAANATAFTACVLLAATGYLSVWGVMGAAVLLGLGLRSANMIDGDREAMATAIRITRAVHALGGLWLAGWIIMS